jgi:hypothetical protein
VTERGAVAPSPLGLRLVHAAIFLAFAAAVVAAAVPEWRHLAAALGQPFHVGEPPRWPLLGACVLAAAGALRLLWGLVRGRSAPLWASAAILLGFVGTVAGGARGPAAERSEDAANLAFLRTARRVHLAMVQELQARGEVPVAPGPWRQALEAAGPRADRVRTRAFRPVPPELVWLSSEEARPEPLVPGALWVHVSPDGASFTLRAVGLRAGQPSLLPDEDGAVLVLRGLYNPELPPSPAVPEPTP